MRSPDQAAFLLALDGAVLGWGPGAESMFGYGAAELVGRPVSVLVPPEGTSAFPRILRAVARGEGVATTETMVGKDGTRFDVVLAVSPARNGGGRVTGARAVVRDVSVERAEEARGRLAAILESTRDAIYTLDARGVIRTWNPGAERLYGYDAHEAMGLPGLSLVPDAVHDDAQMALECVLAGEPVQFFETQARRKDAVLVPVSLNLWPVRDRGGRVVGVSVIACDLTEERLAEATLSESEVRLRESESLAQVGGWVWDVGTGAVQWSEELHRIHGLDPARFAGTLEAHLELVHPEDRELVREAMASAVAHPHPFEVEYRIVRPDGEVRRLYGRAEVALSAADTDADAVTVAGLRGICQDVTERFQAADRRNARAEAVRARQARRELMEQLSADLSGPLGELERSAGKLAAGDRAEGEGAEAVGDVVGAVQRMRAILERLSEGTEPDDPSGATAVADSPR
jgi:PAS domain S-box-containing protein